MSSEKSNRSIWGRIIYNLTHTSALSRFLFFFFCDLLIVTLSLYLCFYTHIHFDFNFKVPYAELSGKFCFFVVLKIGFLVIFRIYNITWRYVGVSLLNIVLAVVVAEMALLILSLPNAYFHLPITGLGKQVFLMDGFFTLAFISGLRISRRLYLEVIREKGRGAKGSGH